MSTMYDWRERAYTRYSRGEYLEAAQLLLHAHDDGIAVEWELSLCLDENQTGSTRAMMEEKARQGNAAALYQL
eukprot:36581-Eustigmatos_ZCMA.PRE.1